MTLTDVDLELSPSYTTAELAEIMVYEGAEQVEEYTNVALGKPVTGSESESGKPLSNITDGNLNSLWVSNGGQTPASASIDLQRTENVEFLELHLEKAGFRFQFKVEVEDANGNRETVLDMTSNTEDNEKSYKIPVGKEISKIHATITGKAEGGEYPAAWSAIAEIKAMGEESSNKGEQASIAIPQGNMTATATSEHPNVGSEGLASFAIDGNPNTIWHTNYSQVQPLPQGITVELGGGHMVNKFTYLPRTGSKNGIITKYELHLSEDGENFTKVSEGEWADNGALKIVSFDAKKATHAKLVAVEGSGGFASAAELNVFAIPEKFIIIR